MKICILTQPLNTNYGGLLQAYALQTVLKRMGHEVVTDRKGITTKNNTFIRRCLSFVYHFIQHYILGKKQYNPFLYFFTSKDRWRKEAMRRIAVNTDRFIETQIAYTSFFDNPNCSLKQFDVIIVGSDQVWRRAYSNVSVYFLYFAFNHPIKRIAYAASFGINTLSGYSSKEIKKCKEGAKRFDAISVREDSGIELCSKHLGVEAVHLLDPTLLLEKKDYLSIIEEEDLTVQSRVLMCYVLDKSEDRQAIIHYIAKKLNLFPLEVMPKERFKLEVKNLKSCVFPSVSKWISGFRDAEFVVTDSFHGTVFAIIFNKPFVAISNAQRGASRFTSLLKMFGLEHRLINSIDELTNEHLKHIDYTKVNQIKKEWQKKSFYFLKHNLS